MVRSTAEALLVQHRLELPEVLYDLCVKVYLARKLRRRSTGVLDHQALRVAAPPPPTAEVDAGACPWGCGPASRGLSVQEGLIPGSGHPPARLRVGRGCLRRCCAAADPAAAAASCLWPLSFRDSSALSLCVPALQRLFRACRGLTLPYEAALTSLAPRPTAAAEGGGSRRPPPLPAPAPAAAGGCSARSAGAVRRCPAPWRPRPGVRLPLLPPLHWVSASGLFAPDPCNPADAGPASAWATCWAVSRTRASCGVPPFHLNAVTGGATWVRPTV